LVEGQHYIYSIMDRMAQLTDWAHSIKSFTQSKCIGGLCHD
jgi:hypothetical protein